MVFSLHFEWQDRIINVIYNKYNYLTNNIKTFGVNFHEHAILRDIFLIL